MIVWNRCLLLKLSFSCICIQFISQCSFCAGREFIRTSPRPTDNLLNDSNNSYNQGSYNQGSYPSPYNSPQITNKHSPRQHIGTPVGSPTQVRNPFGSPAQGRTSNNQSPREIFIGSPTQGRTSNNQSPREIFIGSPVSSPSQVRFAEKHSPREHMGSPFNSPSQGRMTVKVLTHRGSVSSDSE